MPLFRIKKADGTILSREYSAPELLQLVRASALGSRDKLQIAGRDDWIPTMHFKELRPLIRETEQALAFAAQSTIEHTEPPKPSVPDLDQLTALITKLLKRSKVRDQIQHFAADAVSHPLSLALIDVHFIEIEQMQHNDDQCTIVVFWRIGRGLSQQAAGSLRTVLRFSHGRRGWSFNDWYPVR